ncbi:MAG: Gfo/Idh/MocA family oxidoreductase [Gemmataceae bacterium]|nr:Gfo/Idh/MocA family oxidoreductase [Gemmataceae bacterium]MDW8266216.1 Gfo/Idh/MocA family oxidoreductase [Gemmataceae bacterium]
MEVFAAVPARRPPETVRRLRWGILGVARINEQLIPAFARAANAELRAIASRSAERAAAAARSAGIPRAYGSYEALIDDPEIDAVYVPLPNHLHGPWTMRAAERGKHVLCEKPLAPTAAEAQQIVDCCRQRGVCLMDGFMWPHHPRTARLRQFLDSGGIGPVQRVTGAFTFTLRPLDPSNIRLHPEYGGGSLLDVGCYPVFGIRWAFGSEPIAAYATAVYQHGVDVALTGVLRWADGRQAAFDCGFTQPYRGWLEITGTEGVVFVPEMWLPPSRATFEVHRDDQPCEEVVLSGHDQIVRMIEDFGKAVLEGTPVHPPPEEAVKTLRVLDALAASAREGREVAIA